MVLILNSLKKIFEKIKQKFSVAVSNGTAALEIAIKSLNLKKRRNNNS